MTGCLRMPVSLADAELILVCAGGTHWRDQALLGLTFVLGLMAFAFVVWLLLPRETA